MPSSFLFSLLGIGVPALVILWGIFAYNRLVKYRQQVSEGWSGIDVQLKKRSNLIPNLVKVVKGYAAHEKSTLTEVTELRAQCVSSVGNSVDQRGKVEGGLASALTRLLLVAENYPDLKADGSFRDLQSTLTEVENDIEMARRYYNGAVRLMNVSVESFPSNLVAKQFHFTRAEYFQLENPDDRQAPGVKL